MVVVEGECSRVFLIQLGGGQLKKGYIRVECWEVENEWCTRVVETGPKSKTEPLQLSFS